VISYHFKYFTMKKSTYYLILAFVTLILSSCTTTLYVPNAVNTPLLKEKHEFKATIGPNNAQAAFGLTDNFGIIANGYWDKFKSETTTNGQTTQTLNKGNLYELGLGYYKPLTKVIVFETYLGGGLGNIDFNQDNGTKRYDVKGTKFFVQPSIGYVDRFLEVAITPRLSAVKYNGLETFGYSQKELEEEFLVKSEVEDKTWLFIEPTLTVRAGFKYVKLQGQIGFSSKLTKGDLKYQSKLTSIGLLVDIAKWYK